jgi:hypothetical protein
VRFYNNERKASFLLNQFQNGKEVKVGEYSSLMSHLDLNRGEPLKWVSISISLFHAISFTLEKFMYPIECSIYSIFILSLI